MERYVSNHPPVLHCSAQLGAGFEPAAPSTEAQQVYSSNYLAARWSAQRGGNSGGNMAWESAVCVSGKLATLQRHLSARSTFLRTDLVATRSSSAKLDARLRDLEALLDKLLSSFDGVVLDPAERVHCASVCVASSRATVEHLPNLLAIQPHLEAVNVSMSRFESSARDAAVALHDGSASPASALRVSKQLEELEGQLSVAESLVMGLRSVSQESNAVLDAVSEMYAATC